MEPDGDPEVLLVTSLALSAAFGAVLVGSLSLLGVVEPTAEAVGLATLLPLAVTWFVALR